MTKTYIYELLKRCLEEDGCFFGDVTTASLNISGDRSRFFVNVRGSGTVAALEPIADSIEVFGDLSMKLLHKDGDTVTNENIAILEGAKKDILAAERTILNVLGYASGVATKTKLFVDAIEGTDCKICDTRKTTPGLRLLDKYAVTCGGGTSHRMGLHDAALYKDNHLAGMVDIASELGTAISCVKEHSGLKFIEVEVDSIEQLEYVLLLPVDIILLDNMPLEMLRAAVVLRNDTQTSVLLEASGGVTLNTVRSIAETGIDRISIGGLVHQATWVDVGLDAIDE